MTIALERPIRYPDSDGKPMSDNTEQFKWIVLIKENLECLFAENPEVFIAGDLLWYPVEGHPEICAAPDAMAAFGRPKGYRGSYQQWKEEGIAPQVTFEILSPSNTLKEMTKKQEFYERYGVEEYYIYDPDRNDLNGLLRVDDRLTVIDEIRDWVSPRLGIRFLVTDETLEVYYPDGRRFLTTVEFSHQAQEATARAEQETNRANQEADRAARLAERLRSLGIDPEQI